MARRKVKAVDTWKLKRWYTIVAPKIWGEKEVGETAADEEEKLIGRKVEVLASELTGNFGHAHYILWFQINEVAGSVARTEFLGYEVDRAFIKRMTRRHSSKIEYVFDVDTKDGKRIHVKAVTWTATRASDAQATAVRKIMKEMIEAFAGEHTRDETLKEFVVGELTSKIAEKVRKILPVRRVEVVKARTLKEARG